MILKAKQGSAREFRLHVIELVAPPINEQDLPLSSATEIEWVMATDPDATTATLSKTLSDGEISFLSDGDDGWIKFSLSASECDRTGRFFWELRITLGGSVYVSEEIGVIDFRKKMAAAA